MEAGLHHHRPHRLLLGIQATSTPPPPPSSNESPTTRGSYTNEANFDTNMVIILAALLFALVCALGLNSIVRCALRCSRGFAFEASDETITGRLAATGLKRRALKNIPVVGYSSGLNIKASDCLICLGEFMEGEKVRVLPKCNHGFHVRCIDTWLLSHSSCPTCRHSLLETAATSGGDADVAIPEQGNNPVAGGHADVAVSVDELG